jgi:hypothetical protein
LEWVLRLAIGAEGWFLFPYTLFSSCLKGMSPPSEATIRALAATFTPSLRGDTAQLRRIYSNFCYVYGDLPSATRTKLALLVRVIEAFSWLRYGRALSGLSMERRESLCRTMANAPIGRLQAGFGGLRSLVLNATYTEPGMWERIDYAGPTVGREGVGARGKGGVGE